MEIVVGGGGGGGGIQIPLEFLPKGPMENN